VALYQQEREALFQAAGDRAVLADLEDLFLVLEGVGVWANTDMTGQEAARELGMSILRIKGSFVPASSARIVH
jgi:hypothetical protein